MTRHALPHSIGPLAPPADPGLAREQRLARAFVQVAATRVDGFDLVEFLYTLVDRCVELLDVTAVGIMCSDDHGRLRVAACSGEETGLLELFQLQNNEGPCLECHRTGKPVEARDLAQAGERWPRFAPEAVRAGFRAVHALPMRLHERTLGSLNLFHIEAGALTPAVTGIAQALADVASVGLLQVEFSEQAGGVLTQLRRALLVRVVIEQAKGVLAEQCGRSPDEAFAVLRSHARKNGLGLAALAYSVLDGDSSRTDLAELTAELTEH